jgi:ABC-type Zn uptake system ZnuABC Zn-binding protein ZnuA
LIHGKSVFFIAALILIPLSVSSLTLEVRAQIQPVLNVAVSVPSLAGIVEDVGGPLVTVSTILNTPQDPHTFTINPEILSIADSADLLVFTGHFQWEEDLANQTATPFITLNDESAVESYADYGARLSPLPGGLVAEGQNGNPHGYWLLPINALAIANATREALSLMNAAFADSWTSNFNSFVERMNNLESFIGSLDETHDFSQMQAVLVTPPEAYVAEAFGIQCDTVLQVEDITLSAAKLLEVQTALRNGTVQLILGSDLSQFEAAGEYSYQLQADYGGTLIWWQTLFFSGDYFSLMNYNLGALVSGIADMSGSTTSEGTNIGLVALATVLGIMVVIETTLLILRARAE